MTHDELVALLNSKSDSDEIHALRAVVELEKVVPSFNIDKELYDMPINTALQVAYANGFIDSRAKVFQVIEKELA